MNIKQPIQAIQSLSLNTLPERVDLNQMLTGGSDAALLIQIEGGAPDIGIFDGDWIMIDKAKKPKENDIVITLQNGEYIIKRHEPDTWNGLYLVTNELRETIDKYEIFGVVTFIIKTLEGVK